MRFSRPRALAALLLALLGLSAVASAADPANGTVSAASPTVTWEGELLLPYVSYAQLFLEEGAESVGCEAPHCDRFTLEVKDGPADLTVSHEATNVADGGIQMMRIIAPDGKVTFATDDVADEPQTMKLKAAKNGTYLVDITNGSKTQAAYTATATLATPAGGGTPGQPPGLVTDPPATGDPGAKQPGDAGNQPLTVTAKAPRLSARKLARSRKAVVSVTTNRAAAVRATLLKGKRAVGSGKAQVEGTKKLALKLKGKLKRGSYTLLLVASDGKSEVRRTVRVKVAR